METVISFRFEGELGRRILNFITGVVLLICRVCRIAQPIVTTGDPPIPGILSLEDTELYIQEACHVAAE